LLDGVWQKSRRKVWYRKGGAVDFLLV